ncbi:glycosyltransferase [Amnibacterium sp. CER49]|uniref:glycosyltransferase n=1 Tax=Amnibacterium sp. CER49 TaxID=3039161 RepID=UPI00244AA68B|nr:glycosyltransferase [Amnibacterium sp. CER49]MDH2443962.1 glycosyltransferase [Amnibacterium sp. CER49]
MARILITSARQAGFVLPLTEIARALVAAGHDVHFLSGEAFRGRIEAAGAHYVRLPYDEGTPVPGRAPGSGVQGIAKLLESLFLDPIEIDFRTVRGLVDALGIDLVITEPLFVGSSILGLLPRAERPAVLSVGLFPLMLPSPDAPPYGLALPPIEPPLNELRNVLLDAAARAVLAPVTRRFRQEVQRLTGVRLKGHLFELALEVDAYAQLTVPQFEYPRRALPPKVRFVGPLPAPAFGELPAWWDYSDRRPIVAVTQGTYANEDFTELVVPAIRALEDSGLLVVVTTGGPPPAAVEEAYGGPLPENVRVERFLPYDHLLASASVMVTNGGYGSVHAALRHGLPLVVSGTSEDKGEVNARVGWSGAGIDLKQQRPRPEAVREAVDAVLENGRYRAAARRLGTAIAGTDALRDVLAVADRLVADREHVVARPWSLSAV